MSETAKLQLEGKTFEFPVIVGTENEKAVDFRSLRRETGYITFDDGYANTGSCESRITFIDGEAGILRYRGYPIEQLAANSSFLETAYLVINGELPNKSQLAAFEESCRCHAPVHESMRYFFEGFPRDAHPMAILSAMLNSLGCFYSELATNNHQHDLEQINEAATVLISKVRTLVAMSYRMRIDAPFNYPKRANDYCEEFLHLMFSEPYQEYKALPEVTKALNLILLLHADHEQNCSTSTVRMVASSGANLFASVAAGVCALWGPLHGGANMAVIKMLEEIHAEGDDGSRFIEEAKSGKGGRRLMGFGHRVYKNYDPRAKILGESCEKLLKAMGIKDDPLLDIARHLEQAALQDEYFVQRKLYPNVDFYSGIILKAIGIPVDMFTVMFSIGRIPGWIANWKEIASDPKPKIHRPRQVYQGSNIRDYLPLEKRS